jgi:hypothetical protein
MAKKDKRTKQKRKLEKDKLKARKWAERNKYPRVEFAEDGEDPAFMATVKEILCSFDYDDDSHCRPEERYMYGLFRSIGLEGMERWIASPDTQQRYMQPGATVEDFRNGLLKPLYMHLGEWVFSRLPDTYRKDPLPFYYYYVAPVDNALVVTFEFLPHLPSEHGTIYHSPYNPTVRKGGGDFKVGFLRHAIERVCERLSALQPITYSCFQPLAFYFRHCVFFEPLNLPDGQEGIRLFARCDGSFGRDYLRQVMSLDDAVIEQEQDQFVFVLGYCPVEIVRKYAVAKTFLYPGYGNTPEAALVASAPVSQTTRKELRAAARDNTLAALVKSNDFDLVKWYHENGVPQVVRRPEELYQYG